jgi:Ca-activated chloride channel homolog
MIFLWNELLWILALLPVLVAVYFLVLRRGRKAALRYASLGMVKQAMGPGQRLRRHVPAALLLLAVTALILAMARPATVLTLPARYETVVLAMDVSGSMRAADVAPDRLSASQLAARSFVESQPNSTRIGVVSFSRDAMLLQPPTQNRDDIMAAITRLHPQGATAIGNGILVSLKAIFPEIDIDLLSRHRRPLDAPPKPATRAVPAGSYSSAVIVLLTDGQNTTGADPIEAAKMAADRGVRVYTVGVGTAEGTVLTGDGWQMRVRLDEETLKQVADMTRAEYFNAVTGADLNEIYRTLTARFTLETKQTEVTALFAAAGTLLVLLSAVLSLLWFSRVF